MDESLQAKLAKSNINITGITEENILFEFPYHPRPGEVRWCKSYIFRRTTPMSKIPELVLELRKTLER